MKKKCACSSQWNAFSFIIHIKTCDKMVYISNQTEIVIKILYGLSLIHI